MTITAMSTSGDYKKGNERKVSTPLSNLRTNNKRLQLNNDEFFDGLAIISGSYRIRGRNDASLDKNFSAKLDVVHNVFFILKFEDGFFASDKRQLRAFLDCVSTVLVKAKGFRNPGCRDWVDFDHNCGIKVDYFPSPNSDAFPDNDYYALGNVGDMQVLYNDFAELYDTPSTLVEIPEQRFESCYQRFMSLFNSLSTDNARTIKGWFNIRAASHHELTHNIGYSANLDVSSNINIDLHNCSSNQKSCLQNEISTARFKANTFKNPQCKDMVFFTGKVKVEYASGTPPKVFDIVDWNSFQNFADFIQNHFPAISNIVKDDPQSSLKEPLLFKSGNNLAEPTNQLQQTKFYCPRISNFFG